MAVLLAPLRVKKSVTLGLSKGAILDRIVRNKWKVVNREGLEVKSRDAGLLVYPLCISLPSVEGVTLKVHE